MIVVLTDQQKVFCEEYLKCLNTTEAAKRAGYCIQNAKRIGEQNLMKVHIQKYIKEINDGKIPPPNLEMLSDQEKAFCDYFIETGNIADSMTRAGISKAKNKTTLVKMGKRILESPTGVRYIEERNKELESIRIADIKEVKEFWTEVLRNPDSNMKDRLKATEYLAKTEGAFLDKVEQSGAVDIKVEWS